MRFMHMQISTELIKKYKPWRHISCIIHHVILFFLLYFLNALALKR